jgi:hypothetical protein
MESHERSTGERQTAQDDLTQARGVEFGARGCLTSVLCAIVFGLVTYYVASANNQPSAPIPAGSTNSPNSVDRELLSIFMSVFAAMIIGGLLGVVIGSRKR